MATWWSPVIEVVLYIHLHPSLGRVKIFSVEF